MRWRKLTFRQAMAGDVRDLLRFSKNKPCGVEIWSSLQLDGENTAIGSLWTGRDKQARLRLVLYDNGAYCTWLTARRGLVARPPSEDGFGLFAVPKRKTRLCRMVYRGRAVPFPDGVQTLQGTAILKMYQMVREPPALEDKTERRYVTRVRAVNAGLAETFGVYEDGHLASTASICAKNERYALIGDVYTIYQYRFQGYASRLTAACVATAQAQGLTPLLYCDASMRKFYRKLGFREVLRTSR